MWLHVLKTWFRFSLLLNIQNAGEKKENYKLKYANVVVENAF